jgi:hypothetical protein
MRHYHGNLRQCHECPSLRIPLFEPLKRLSGELGVGLHLVALNQNCKYSQPRRLEKSTSRRSETATFDIEGLGGGSPATDTTPRTPRKRDKSVLIPFAQEPFGFESIRVFPITRCGVICKPTGVPTGQGGSYGYSEPRGCRCLTRSQRGGGIRSYHQLDSQR